MNLLIKSKINFFENIKNSTHTIRVLTQKTWSKPDITECYMVIFVEQPDKTLLDWCENKWVNIMAQ